MGIYNFMPEFVPAIRSGRKRHTIRGKRVHPDKPGNTLHLYTGLRHKSVELIFRTKCLAVQDILISEDHQLFIEGELLAADELREFARRDGFKSFRKMMDFWDGRLPFQGDIIHWQYPPEPTAQSQKPEGEVRA